MPGIFVNAKPDSGCRHRGKFKELLIKHVHVMHAYRQRLQTEVHLYPTLVVALERNGFYARVVHICFIVSFETYFKIYPQEFWDFLILVPFLFSLC